MPKVPLRREQKPGHPGQALWSLLSSQGAADSSPLAPQAEHPAAPWTKGTRAAPPAPALPRSSGNTLRVKGEGGHRSANGLSGHLGVILALPLLLCLISSQPPVLGAARPGTKSLLPALATQKAAKGSSLLHNTPAWPRVFLTALSTGRAAALTSPAGWEVLLIGTSPWPQPHPPHALAEAPEPGGCPEGVHIWMGDGSKGRRATGQHTEVSSSTAWGWKGSLDPCWGEQWGRLQEQGLRLPALALVCTMHEAVVRWKRKTLLCWAAAFEAYPKHHLKGSSAPGSILLMARDIRTAMGVREVP